MSAARDRYLVVTELFLPTKGGTAVWFDEVYRRLSGPETHIVTADVPGGVEHDRGHPNTIQRVKLQRHWWLRPESLAMYAKLALAAVVIGFRSDFDAVHAGRVLPEGLVAWVIARMLRRPLVIYAHGEELTTWRQPAKRRAMIWTFRRAAKVVANSEFTRDELIKLGVPAERIVLIYPGVDIARFRPGLACADLARVVGLVPGQKLIVSVGRLSRRKGFDHVIRALSSLLEQGLDVRYAIIGIGEDRDYLRELAAKCGVASRVSLLGHVDPVDLPRWYNAADVVAMPNREIDGDTEGFGMVFIEASACGKPVVAGTAGGTAAAVIDGVTGLRIDGNSVEAVAGALMRILADDRLAVELGANGLERARDEFSWDRVAERTRELQETLRG